MAVRPVSTHGPAFTLRGDKEAAVDHRRCSSQTSAPNVLAHTTYRKDEGSPVPDAGGYVLSDHTSPIRRHLRVWQEQLATEPSLGTVEDLPGFDVSRTTTNAISQSGEYTPDALSSSGDADLSMEPRPELDADGQVDDAAFDQRLLNSGDMVNILTNGNQHTGIVTRSHRDLLQVYTIQGEVLDVFPWKATFRLERIVSPRELAPVVPHLPTEMVKNRSGELKSDAKAIVPRDVGSPLINKMLNLTTLADECYRKYAYRLDHVWEIMQPTRSSHVFSLDEIATKVFKTPNMSMVSSPMMWCLHRVLIQDERFLLDSRFHRMLPRFTFLLQRQHGNRLTVRKWVRDYQEYQASDTTASFDNDLESDDLSPKPNALYAFIQKAQALVQENREIRDLDSTGQLGLSKVKDTTVKFLQATGIKSSPPFTNNDQRIIQCLSDWVLAKRIPDSTSTASIGPAILRASGIYEGLQLDRSTGFTLLKEMGVITPWEQRMIHAHEFPLPGHGLDSALDELQKSANPLDYKLKDSMEGLRKDWGDLPVFCIDAFSAVEIDDGVSWEAADEGSSWIHVHVANPSAFIDKDSTIAQYAAKLSRTLYLIERRYSMLESDTVRNHCSLAPGCPAITFSARINTDGDIVENKVTHGILHNIKYVTPETINKHLFPGLKLAEKPQMITVGGEWPAKAEHTDEPLTDFEQDILSKLREMGSARRLKRNPAIQFTASLPKPEVFLGKDHPPFGLVLDHARRIVGDPLIAMPIRPFDPRKDVASVQASEEFVSDMMLIAGEVAATWCAERGIPIVYTGTVVDPTLRSARDKFEDNVIRKAIAKDKSIPRPLANRFFELTGRTSSSAVPLEHLYLKLPAYSRATSPLRRYGDLFNHWQIDAAVRYEASTGTSLIGNTDDHFLPFSLAETEDMVKIHDMRTDRCNVLTTRSRQHWTTLWFYRAYYHGQAPVPRYLTAYILRVSTAAGTSFGTIKEMGLSCIVRSSAVSRAENGLEEGDTWEIRIDNVDIYESVIYAEPIRLLEKSDIASNWPKYS